MTKAAAQQAMDYGMHRFLADGAHYRDLIDIREALPDWEHWPQTWSKWAEQAEKRGESDLAAGSTLTAAAEFARASLYYHCGQYLLYDDLQLKRTVHDKKVAAFHRALPLFQVPMQAVEIPYDGITMPAYFRVPPGIENPPCIVLLGGLDTTKEDYLMVSDLCIARGLATIAFDGPGQGETFFKMPLKHDFERSISAVIDYLETRPEIDKNRIGLIGRSLGGYWGPKAAALDHRIKALVVWCVLFSFAHFPDIPKIHEHSYLGLKAVSNSKDFEEAKAFYSKLDLTPWISKVECPSLLSHGGLDRITPMINVDQMRKGMTCPTEELIWEDSGHCCHDRSHILRPAIADFLRRHLK